MGVTEDHAGAPATVGDALVRLAGQLEREGIVQVGGAFTDLPAADAFVRSSPEAFLVGVLFTQGIPAERAWAAPWLLRERLGHFDLYRLATEREAVTAAVGAPPALHRFRVTVAGWVSDAAALLLEQWGGSAKNIWAGAPPARVLMERLMEFPGIGRKKAAMAVELLRRSLGVAVSEISGGTVAYDTHVRRVFLRSGLVDRDTREDVEVAAAAACPSSPGTLDLPAWLIGRQWCRPAEPDCDTCPIGEVCPRLTGRSVPGVGARTPRPRGMGR